MLQHVVEMDPTYAPAWEELGLRATTTPTTPMAARRCSSSPTRPASTRLQLDPNLIVAAGQLITNRVERGELGKAYQAAQALVKRRPDSAQAHFVMSYVYRYAGMLEQATGMRHRAGARSRQLHLPLVRMGVHGIGQDGARGGLCSPRCRLGVGGLCHCRPCCCVRAKLPRRAKP